MLEPHCHYHQQQSWDALQLGCSQLYALMYQLETDERKNDLGCSWDVRDAQDAFKTDPNEG